MKTLVMRWAIGGVDLEERVRGGWRARGERGGEKVKLKRDMVMFFFGVVDDVYSG